LSDLKARFKSLLKGRKSKKTQEKPAEIKLTEPTPAATPVPTVNEAAPTPSPEPVAVAPVEAPKEEVKPVEPLPTTTLEVAPIPAVAEPVKTEAPVTPAVTEIKKEEVVATDLTTWLDNHFNFFLPGFPQFSNVNIYNSPAAMHDIWLTSGNACTYVR
jgi:outer membrane biosynthesis protein TonB